MDNSYYENVQICAGILKKEYLQALYHRTGKKIEGQWLFNRETNKLVDQVSRTIKDIRLAKLFIEAQFALLPSAWCKSTFKKSYPPVKVVFGNGCLTRYRSYVENGISQPA